jgi:DNA-binding transcriptional MerR regulator
VTLAYYTITDLEHLCGIKAHTLRAWEQRYGLLRPKRTDANVRYYTEEDLKHLLNVVQLMKNGWKISAIAKLNPAELEEEIIKLAQTQSGNVPLDALTMAMLELDEVKFERMLVNYIKKVGFARTMLEVIQPFLERISLLWLTGGSVSPSHEQFITNLIRQKLIAAIDQVALPTAPDAPRLLIYLPEGERQELSVLFMQYLARANKCHVLYLGQDVLLNELADAVRIYRPDYLVTMVAETYSSRPVQEYVSALSRNYPDTQLILTGYQVISQEVQETEHIHVIASMDQFVEFLGKIQKQQD